MMTYTEYKQQYPDTPHKLFGEVDLSIATQHGRESYLSYGVNRRGPVAFTRPFGINPYDLWTDEWYAWDEGYNKQWNEDYCYCKQG